MLGIVPYFNMQMLVIFVYEAILFQRSYWTFHNIKNARLFQCCSKFFFSTKVFSNMHVEERFFIFNYGALFKNYVGSPNFNEAGFVHHDSLTRFFLVLLQFDLWACCLFFFQLSNSQRNDCFVIIFVCLSYCLFHFSVWYCLLLYFVILLFCQ